MAASSSSEPIAIQRVRALQPGRLELACPALTPAGALDDIHSGYHDNLSPPLDWTAMPDAETFALIVQDPDAPMAEPFLHWAVWNIPGRVHGLPQGLGPVGAEGFEGMRQGRNAMGSLGYIGPHPPEGDGPHRYHFQLFALDGRLTLKPNGTLEELVSILKGDTLASAELVATYAYDTAIQAPAEPSERSFMRDLGRGGLDDDDLDRHAPHEPQGVVQRHA